ncbi:MAG: ABC transporter ATP-binding protein [Clostridia bacterium]|nr:ABC transporter ATP-binding protein [Clostridia bacterium]
MNLLEVRGLSKAYRAFSLQSIRFALPAGYIMGYIGQNGAGKTTTLNAITHLIVPDEGDAAIDGVTFEDDPVAYRDSIGYIGDASYFPGTMRLSDIKTILRDFYPSFRPDRFDGYVERWQLPPKEKLKNYSRGMKVKLMFAAVLSRNTKLLILDEATNGLDPVMRRDVLRLLQDYIADGTRSVLFSTHIMEDLQDIADYIFFIENGREVLFETKDELLERYLLVKGGPDMLTDALRARLIGVEEQAFGFSALFPTDAGGTLPPGLIAETPTIDQIVVHMIEEAR